MSQENVEIVRRLVGAWNRGNIDTLLGFFDPDCEVTFPPEVPEPGDFVTVEGGRERLTLSWHLS